MGKFKLNSVEIEWLGHASFRISDGTVVIYIDPYVLPEYAEKADLILVTHDHFDHCATDNIKKIADDSTVVVCPPMCESKLVGLNVKTISPGDKLEEKGVVVEAVHSYNLFKAFHPKGKGIGFIITLDGKRIYHAGDTDFIPEMKELKNIDVALLPIGGTYTMDEVEAAEAANTIKPKIVVPMHYNYLEGLEKDPERFKKLVNEEIEVKIL